MTSNTINATGAKKVTRANQPVFDVSTAPTLNVSGQLVATPRIERGDDGQLRIAIRGEGDAVALEDVYQVREVVHLHTHPVAMVATDHQVFIVPSSDIPQQDAAPIEASTPTECASFHTPLEHADNLILLMMEMGINDLVAEQHPTLDLARFGLTQSSDPKVAALGYCLGLTALLETPNALRIAVQELRARLSQELPIVW